MSSTRTLTVDGSFDNLARIGQFVTDSATAAQLSDKAAYAVQMAVDEACSNIIEHAYGGEGAGRIRLECDVQAGGLQVVIFDHGQPFDPAQVELLDPETPLERRTRRGMGMFFIHKLMDRVEYRFNTPQGNQLILFKGKDTDS